MMKKNKIQFLTPHFSTPAGIKRRPRKHSSITGEASLPTVGPSSHRSVTRTARGNERLLDKSFKSDETPGSLREVIKRFEGTNAARLKPVSGRADALPSSSHSCETKMRPVYPLDRCRNIFSCELVSDSASARIFQPFNAGDVVPGLALRTRHSGKVPLRRSFSECASDLAFHLNICYYFSFFPYILKYSFFF